MLTLPPVERSLWRDFYPDPQYLALRGAIRVDVAIIGAGITGLSAAYLLKQSGLTVAVLDKATVGSGTTGRTTGKVTSQHGIIYGELEKRFGRDTAQAYAEANQAGFSQIETIIEAEKINYGWRRADNYVFTDDVKKIETFAHEAEAASGLGLPASFEKTAPLPFSIQAAVKFSNQAHFNAQRYLLGLASIVHGGGSHVFEHSPVTGIKDGRPAHIKTKAGRVSAKDVIVATSVPTLPLAARGTYCVAEYPQESYIVAGRLPRRGKLLGMYISPDKHHYSILPVTVEGEDLILIGGEGHISGLRGSVRRRYQRLASYAEKHFQVSEITHRWSDRDYMAYDNLPLVGKLYPWSKHLYAASAYRKWGLTNGTAAALILRDLIIGVDNPWANQFDPHRFQATASIPRVALQHLTGSR